MVVGSIDLICKLVAFGSDTTAGRDDAMEGVGFGPTQDDPEAKAVSEAAEGADDGWHVHESVNLCVFRLSLFLYRDCFQSHFQCSWAFMALKTLHVLTCCRCKQ